MDDLTPTVDAHIRVEAILTAQISADQKAAILNALKLYVDNADRAILESIKKELAPVAYREEKHK